MSRAVLADLDLLDNRLASLGAPTSTTDAAQRSDADAAALSIPSGVLGSRPAGSGGDLYVVTDFGSNLGNMRPYLQRHDGSSWRFVTRPILDWLPTQSNQQVGAEFRLAKFFTGTSSYTIPANFLEAGQLWHFRMHGFADIVNSASSRTINLWTAVLIPNASGTDVHLVGAGSSSTSFPVPVLESNPGRWPFEWEMFLEVVSTGVTGKVSCTHQIVAPWGKQTTDKFKTSPTASGGITVDTTKNWQFAALCSQSGGVGDVINCEGAILRLERG